MNGKSIASLSLKERLANLEKYVDALRTVFSVTSFICSCVGQKIDIFFQSYLVMPDFGQGKCVRVYDRQGKLDKCTINTSMVLANERRPWRKINV